MFISANQEVPFSASYFDELYYTSNGVGGSPIIALHGFGETSYSWRYLVPFISQRNILYLFDLKGHGQSHVPKNEKYSPQDQAEIIYQFIIMHELRDITLIGHSMGGGIALLLAIRLTEEGAGRLKSLILIDSIAFQQKLPIFIRILRTPILGYLVTLLLPAKFQVKVILRYAYFDASKITEDAVTAYAANLKRPNGPRTLVETAKQIIPTNIERITKQYNKISVPTLLIWGKQDRIVSPAIGIMLNTQIEKSELILIDNCGHVPHEETPERVVRNICEFIYSHQ